MRTRATIGLAVTGLFLATLTACSSGSEPSTAPSRASEKPKASAAAKSKPDSPLKLGAGTHWSDADTDGKKISGTTTALAYTQPVDTDLPDEAADFKNPTWAVLEVKVCIDDTSASVVTSQGPWALGFPDDSRLQAPNLSGSGVPKPEYATGDNGARIAAGTCLRGKITFSLEHGQRPDTAVYAPEGRDPIEWTLPKA